MMLVMAAELISSTKTNAVSRAQNYAPYHYIIFIAGKHVTKRVVLGQLVMLCQRAHLSCHFVFFAFRASNVPVAETSYASRYHSMHIFHPNGYCTVTVLIATTVKIAKHAADTM